MSKEESVVPMAQVESRILVIRGKRVMLDRDLAELYGVSTKRLNEQVKRNRERFPEDFMFRLIEEEKAEVVANCDHLRALKFSPTLPYAFTEHGAVMLASVLNSPVAVGVSVLVVRAFVRMRRELGRSREVARRLTELEDKVAGHDEAIRALVVAIRDLIDGPRLKGRKRIGFLPGE